MIRRSNKPFFKNLGILFFAVIILIFVLNLILPDRSFSEKENRVLSSFPAINLKQMGEGRQEAKYETYANDQFLLRDAWITLKAGVDRLLGKVDNNGVWLCKDGYLMESFTAPSAKQEEEILSSIDTFVARNPDLRQYMLVVPNAVNIMSFRLPAGAQVKNQNVYLDRLKSGVKESGIIYIDIRDALNNHSNERLYYKTDHHWTTLAAYYTYLAAADSLDLDTSILTYEQLPVSKEFQGTLSAKSGFRSGDKEEMYVFLPKNDTAPDYVVNYVTERVKTPSYYNTDRLETRDKYAMFFDGNHAVVKIETPTADDRTLLVFKDSYANCFVPFLAPHFRKIIMIDPRYYYGNIDDLIAAEGVTEVLYLYNANTLFTDTSLALTLAGDGTEPQTPAEPEPTPTPTPEPTPTPVEQETESEEYYDEDYYDESYYDEDYYDESYYDESYDDESYYDESYYDESYDEY